MAKTLAAAQGKGEARLGNHHGSHEYSDVGEVLAEMEKRFPAYEGVSLFRLGDSGLSINGQVESS